MSLTLPHRRFPLEKNLARDKHSSLFCRNISDERKKRFLSIGAELSGAVLSVLTIEQIVEQNNTVRMVEHKSTVVI